MDSRLARYVSKLDSIAGWFPEFDAYSLEIITSIQRSNSVVGDILEIGAFHGKSAIALGMLTEGNEALHVCDVFGSKTDSAENDLENEQSYQGLEQQVFERNYLKWHSGLPTIYAMTSNQMFKTIGDERRFRLIHVDGGHLYRDVRDDVRNSVRRIVEGGVICFDDWRRHAGVAAALWEASSDGQLSPFLLTSQKLYAAVGDTEPWVGKLKKFYAEIPEADWMVEEIHSGPVLRMFWSERQSLMGKIARNVVPPGFGALRRRLRF